MANVLCTEGPYQPPESFVVCIVVEREEARGMIAG
jgi:hypothetical protein